MLIQNNYENELNEMFEEQDEINQLQQDQSWAIRDLNTAVWADGIVHAAEVKIEEIDAVYEERKQKLIEKLDAWRDDASKKHKRDIDFFKTHLHMWHMITLEQEQANGVPEKKQSKTIKLPYRELTCRKQQPEILVYGKEPSKVKNDPNFVAFVKENNPEHIKEEVSWGDYKKTLKVQEHNGKLVYVDDAGQTLDFIELIEKGTAFDWKVKKDEA